MPCTTIGTFTCRASETRAVELLDGLCSVMKQWAVVEYNVGGSTAATQVWVRVKGDAVGDLTSAVRASSEEEDTHGKQLEAYCGSLLEEYEDEVYAGLMKGGFDTLGERGGGGGGARWVLGCRRCCMHACMRVWVYVRVWVCALHGC